LIKRIGDRVVDGWVRSGHSPWVGVVLGLVLALVEVFFLYGEHRWASPIPGLTMAVMYALIGIAVRRRKTNGKT
jgi:hypothetical protein